MNTPGFPCWLGGCVLAALLACSCGGPAAGDSGGSDASGTHPAEDCDAPSPWPAPVSKTVVGQGVAASCTADALREAVTAGGNVTFDCGAAPISITVSGEIRVTHDTLLEGAGKVTLAGGGTSRILVVASGATLSVRDLRFTGGRAKQSTEDDGIGGAVAGLWRSRVEVLRCTFEDNAAGRGGGAVSVWTGSSLTIVSSRFVGNRSWYGGAVYSLLSSLQIVSSEFSDNESTGEGGALGTDGADENTTDQQGGLLSICGSRFSNNRGKGAGGAAYLWAYPPDRVRVDRCTVNGNRVVKNVDGAALGGGMRLSNGAITVTRSSFLHNRAEGHGGGLYLDCSPTCILTNSTLFGNEAAPSEGSVAGYGGAVFGDKVRVNNTTFVKNRAGGHGGALFGGTDWTLHNSIFLDNAAGNPWNQANTCSDTVTGAHVMQWLSRIGGAGPDPCIEGLTAADPLLDSAPGDHGGPTQTVLPQTGSPVLQAGQACEIVDQRGQPRSPGACDLGAVELP